VTASSSIALLTLGCGGRADRESQHSSGRIAMVVVGSLVIQINGQP
jgi:hypothetical protein